MSINLVLVDGPDNSGKTTLIKEYIAHGYTLINIPKNIGNSVLKVQSPECLEVFITMLSYFKPGNYVLDRGITSNIVYSRLRRDKGLDFEAEQLDFLRKLGRVVNLEILFLTRNKLKVDFKDDLITLDKEQFNLVIDEFESLYSTLKDLRFSISSRKILEHDLSNNLIAVNP